MFSPLAVCETGESHDNVYRAPAAAPEMPVYSNAPPGLATAGYTLGIQILHTAQDGSHQR